MLFVAKSSEQLSDRDWAFVRLARHASRFIIMKIVCEVDCLEDNEPIIYGPYARRDRLDYNEFAENEDGKRASDSAPSRMLSPPPPKRKSERNSRARGGDVGAGPAVTRFRENYRPPPRG